MSKHFHTVIWIDHHEAKLFNFSASEYESDVVKSTHPHEHLHHKANSGDSGHALPDHEFYKHVSRAIGDAGAILVAGPSSAKQEFVSYVTAKDPGLAKRISGVESLDHPPDGTIVEFARTFFKADDKMRSQT
jgi:stalled ribosome rescue protein Dom34